MNRMPTVLLLVGFVTWAAPAVISAQLRFPNGDIARETPKSPPDTFTPDIPGVVAEGARVQLIRDRFENTEGPIAMPDGSLLFTAQDANGLKGRLYRIDKDGNVSTFMEESYRTLGLGYDSKGRLIATHTNPAGVSVLHPTKMTLASEFGGQPLSYPNDLVIDRKGGIYFTHQINGRFRPPAEGQKPALLYIRPDGKTVLASDQVTNINGLTLSRDEKTLYAVDGPTIAAFDVQPDGSLTNKRKWADGGGDSICIDGEGRVYAAEGEGVRVHSPNGNVLGTIPTPMRTQACAFAGPDKKTLYIVGNGAVWKVNMIVQGFLGRAK